MSAWKSDDMIEYRGVDAGCSTKINANEAHHRLDYLMFTISTDLVKSIENSVFVT